MQSSTIIEESYLSPYVAFTGVDWISEKGLWVDTFVCTAGMFKKSLKTPAGGCGAS
jgi:hypothetical protein